MQKKGKETDLGWKIERRLKLQQSRAPSTGVCLLHRQWGIEEETKKFQIHQFLLQWKQCIISHIDSDSAAWFYALARLPSCWKVSNNPQTTTTTWEDWHDVVKIAKRIELAVKMGKIEGSAMDSRTVKRWIRRWLWRRETIVMWFSQVSQSTNYSNVFAKDRHSFAMWVYLLASARFQT